VQGIRRVVRVYCGRPRARAGDDPGVPGACWSGWFPASVGDSIDRGGGPAAGDRGSAGRPEHCDGRPGFACGDRDGDGRTPRGGSTRRAGVGLSVWYLRWLCPRATWLRRVLGARAADVVYRPSSGWPALGPPGVDADATSTRTLSDAVPSRGRAAARRPLDGGDDYGAAVGRRLGRLGQASGDCDRAPALLFGGGSALGARGRRRRRAATTPRSGRSGRRPRRPGCSQPPAEGARCSCGSRRAGSCAVADVEDGDPPSCPGEVRSGRAAGQEGRKPLERPVVAHQDAHGRVRS